MSFSKDEMVFEQGGLACAILSDCQACEMLHTVFMWTPGDGGEKGDAFYILTEGQART